MLTKRERIIDMLEIPPTSSFKPIFGAKLELSVLTRRIHKKNHRFTFSPDDYVSARFRLMK